MFQYDENLFKEVWKNINDSLNIINSKERVLNELQNCDNLECESDILKLVSSSKQIQKNLEDLNDKIKNTLNIANNNSFVSPLTENNEFNISFELLKELMEIANADSQINLSGIFANFTDYQNIMLSNLSFFELFFRDNENMLKGKTIEDLFLETYDVNNNYTINDYISFSLDTDKIISLNDVDNRNKYLNLFLGKMVLNGFVNIKINELVNGEDSFDAIIFTDQNDDTLVYFSCTDLYEFDDYLYDAYPILNTFSNLGKSIGEVANAEKIYKSQQRQALELVKKYLSNDNSKVNIGGFSLGGSLAEYSYFSLYGNNNLNNLVLFNPFHVEVNKNDLTDAFNKEKIKIYAAEGDAVSTVLNYDIYKEYTTPVYIDYQDVISKGKELAISDNNLLNRISTNLKNIYCDNLINSCNDLSERFYFKYYPAPQVGLYLKGVSEIAEEMKKYDVNSQEYISLLAQCSDKAEPILNIVGDVIDVDLDLSFIEKFEYVEILFSGVHMPYSVEVSKTTSFDSTGKTLSTINGVDVEYPSFEETSSLIFSSNIYDEIKDLTYNIGEVQDEYKELKESEEYRILEERLRQ